MRQELVAFGACLALAIVGCSSDDAGDDSAGATNVEAVTGTTVKGTPGGRICSWNIRRLGHQFNDLPKNHDAVAQIMKDHCDVVVVQELMQSDGGNVPGFFSLKNSLGWSWDGAFTLDARPLGESSNSERHAFYWRKSVAHLCEGFDPGADTVRYVSDPKDVFQREPAFTCLRVRARENDLLIASYHALFGEIAERKREVAQIAEKDIFAEIQAARPGADVMLVGDLNLKPNELAEALPTFSDLTAGAGSTINLHDDITDNQYDHLLMRPDAPLAKTLKPAEVLDVRPYTAEGATYFETISDHLPIRFVIRE